VSENRLNKKQIRLTGIFGYLCTIMQERKQNNFKTPDITKMQEVVINLRTKIYIAIDADPEEARRRYWERQDAKGKALFTPRKTTVS
jgi:hypothetical protein